MPHQEALTIAAPICEERLSSLVAVLAQMQADPGHNPLVPFGRLPNCHFARLFWWEAATTATGLRLAPTLLLLADCDGSSSAMLKELIDVSGAGIDQVFEHCAGYPSTRTSATRLAYLKRHRVRERAHYVHRPGRTVSQILEEAHLRDAVGAFVDGLDAGSLSALEVHSKVRNFVQQHPQLSSTLQAPAGIGRWHRAKEKFDCYARPLALLVFGPLVMPAVAATLLSLRLLELSDQAPHIRPATAHLERLTVLEDFAAHNPYSAGGFIKPGPLRRFTLDTILELVDYGVRHLFNADSLAGVKSIHFARWIPLEGGRMVFASNFDGSVESYNEDFINLIGWGLNLVFSNGENYPPTRWLVFGGASYEQNFKDHLRRHQIPVPVAYAAYPTLSALNIERNAQLRAGLSAATTEEDAQQWLSLF